MQLQFPFLANAVEAYNALVSSKINLFVFSGTQQLALPCNSTLRIMLSGGPSANQGYICSDFTAMGYNPLKLLCCPPSPPAASAAVLLAPLAKETLILASEPDPSSLLNDTWPPSPSQERRVLASPKQATYVRDTVLIEGWLDIKQNQWYRKNYRSVRVCSPGVWTLGYSSTFNDMTCYKYTIWCIPKNLYNWNDSLNFKELYDLGLDPFELNNRLIGVLTPQVSKLIQRLDGVLSAMAYCTGPGCRNPWRTLHPDGSVNSLYDAMQPAWDIFYASRKTFAFTSCNTYYSPSNERYDSSSASIAQY